MPERNTRRALRDARVVSEVDSRLLFALFAVSGVDAGPGFSLTCYFRASCILHYLFSKIFQTAVARHPRVALLPPSHRSVPPSSEVTCRALFSVNIRSLEPYCARIGYRALSWGNYAKIHDLSPSNAFQRDWNATLQSRGALGTFQTGRSAKMRFSVFQNFVFSIFSNIFEILRYPRVPSAPQERRKQRRHPLCPFFL